MSEGKKRRFMLFYWCRVIDTSTDACGAEVFTIDGPLTFDVVRGWSKEIGEKYKSPILVVPTGWQELEG